MVLLALSTCAGVPELLTVNLNVTYSLLNGSMGQVEDIFYLNKWAPVERQPDVLW